MTTSGDWSIFAKWQVGELTDAEYADYLEERDGKEDFVSQMLVKRLRGQDMSAEEADRFHEEVIRRALEE